MTKRRKQSIAAKLEEKGVIGKQVLKHQILLSDRCSPRRDDASDAMFRTS